MPVVQGFEYQQVLPGILMFRETYFAEHANIYAIYSNNECLVIDPGLGFGNIKNTLNTFGFNQFQATATHCHFDHIAGLKHFSKQETFLDSKIAQHLELNEMLALNFFHTEDLDCKMVKTLFNCSPDELHHTFSIPKIEFTILSSQIKIGNFCFEILHTPGHSSDSISFYEPTVKILISGDALYKGEIYTSLIDSSLMNFMKTLDAIERMDVNTVLPGHNDCLDKITTKKTINTWKKNLSEKIDQLQKP